MSGTTDPVILQRIAKLEATKKFLLDIITKVESGQMREADIPITIAAYNNFLPALTSTSTALPQLISDSGLNSILNSLFPVYGTGSVSGAQVAKDFFNKYASNFMKNISWDFSISSRSDAEEQIAREVAKGFLGEQHVNNQQSNNTAGKGDYMKWKEENNYSDNDTQWGHGGTKQKSLQSMPSVAPPKYAPVKLDWKERSQQICDQISKRGLNPYDFGCMKNTDQVNESFSYRGYARMICNRLGTHYDTGIPQLCGCPPPSWPGWKPQH
jgi:hypothetical protein